jgi:hypothetical protein
MVLTKGTKMMPSSLLVPMTMGTLLAEPSSREARGMAGIPLGDPSTTVVKGTSGHRGGIQLNLAFWASESGLRPLRKPYL